MQSLIGQPEGRYLVVGHGGILNEVLRVVFSTPIAVNRVGTSFGFGDDGFAVLTYHRPVHRWVLREFDEEVAPPGKPQERNRASEEHV